MNIKKVRSLLDEIKTIRGKEILSKCRYCKKSNPAGKCQRCEYIINKFSLSKKRWYEDRQNSFEQWLYKVRLFLKSLSEGKYVCKQNINRESFLLDYEKLLSQLDSPIMTRELDIRSFPEELDIINENKVMLREIISNLKNESFSKRHPSEDSLCVSPSQTSRSCICKHFMSKYNKQRLMGAAPSIHEAIETRTETEIKQIPEKLAIELNTPKETISKSVTTFKKPETIKTTDKIIKKKVQNRKSKENKENVLKEHQKIDKPKKHTITSEEQLLFKMTKERDKQKSKLNTLIKPDKIKSMPNVDLPELKILSTCESSEESFDKVIECGDQQQLHLTEMIKGNTIVNINCYSKSGDKDIAKPLFFKVKPECTGAATDPFPLYPSTSETNKFHKLNMTDNHNENLNDKSTKGVIYYQLSNREFIDKGWTKLPLKKIVRKMNIYKMISPNPKFDWFERNKSKRLMRYATGEKLAEIEENGCGRWYYKNGVVALDYYIAEKLNADRRYTIYNSGDEGYNGKPMPIAVLAYFDFLGNGVVYDYYGNIRLKYNQSEGIVIDDKIAPPGHWKWHTLNDPPVLQPALVNITDNEDNTCLHEMFSENREEIKKDSNQEMLTIELENVFREKANKMLQKFRPFQIRMKVLKINDKFSLRIMDQANIYVLFRDGKVSLKLNLGLQLLSNEIIDSETIEVSQVAIPCNRNPAI